MLEDYLKAKNGQHLVDLGICPKDSSRHLALITRKRLEAIRDRILAGLNDEMLGRWESEVFDADVNKEEVRIGNIREMQKYVKVGMRVKGTGSYDNADLRGMYGVVKVLKRDDIWGIEWENELPRGHNLDGLCKQGHGWNTSLNAFDLIIPTGSMVENAKLADGVVADKKLGHKVRFTANYEGKMKDGRSQIDVKLPKGLVAMLSGYDAENRIVSLKVEENVEGNGNRKNFDLPVEGLHNVLEVSSLGQVEPADKENSVREETLRDFFPKTVLETERAEQAIIALLMGKDVVFYGPPGSGKSEAANDIISVAKQQKIIFHVDGCQVQCNPFSVFDSDFAKIVPPCPECMINYDKDFKDTGRFRHPKPKDVRVVAANYTEGKGIEFVAGTTRLNRMDLAGFKIPKLDGTTTAGRESEFDPEGFHAGILSRTNNGILYIEEMDKLRPAVLEEFLDALQREQIKPEMLRYTYPADALIIGTANDHTKFPDPLVDRMFLIAVRYPDSVDTRHHITRRAYYKETVPVEDTPIDDTHQEVGDGLRAIPMPAIIERAVDALYMKFGSEYKGTGKSPISVSNRCKIDALDVARAKLMLDQLFYAKTPKIANVDYAVSGIQFAMCRRVRESSPEADIGAKKELSDWVAKAFPAALKEEEDTWWCRAYKHIAASTTQVPEIEGNFTKEIAEYEKDPVEAVNPFKKVKLAYQHPDNKGMQKVRIEYPFMDYLFKEQPGFGGVTEPQLIEMMRYFTKSREGVSCKLGE